MKKRRKMNIHYIILSLHEVITAVCQLTASMVATPRHPLDNKRQGRKREGDLVLGTTAIMVGVKTTILLRLEIIHLAQAIVKAVEVLGSEIPALDVTRPAIIIIAQSRLERLVARASLVAALPLPVVITNITMTIITKT